MSSKDHVRLSKFLSLVLRHDPNSIGIVLDPNGWTSVDALIERASAHGHPFGRETLAAIVRESDKQRFALSEDGSMIRANQGHSVQVDLGYEAAEPPLGLFHGTAARNTASILAQGLIKGARHHVHLSSDLQTAHKVGQRRGPPVVFRVNSGSMYADGLTFFRSANGVWLTDHVPPIYLERLL